MLVAGAAFMEDLGAEASMVEAAFTEGLAEAHSEAEEAFAAGTAAGATTEASGGTVGMAVAATMEAFIEASGGTADLVIPTSASAWALASTPGPIGLDRITAATDIPIIPTTGAILTALIPATRMVMGRTPTVSIYVTLLILLMHLNGPPRLRILKPSIRLPRRTLSLPTASGTGLAKARGRSRRQVPGSPPLNRACCILRRLLTLGMASGTTS